MDKILTLFDYNPSNEGSSSVNQNAVKGLLIEFKEGVCSDIIKNEILDAILDEIRVRKKVDYTICFVPASKLELTVLRFSELADYINEKLPDKAYLNTLSLAPDYDELLEGERKIVCAYPERIRGKDVYFIDDVFNTGKSHSGIIQLLKSHGVKNTYGIYIAKVVKT